MLFDFSHVPMHLHLLAVCQLLVKHFLIGLLLVFAFFCFQVFHLLINIDLVSHLHGQIVFVIKLAEFPLLVQLHV